MSVPDNQLAFILSENTNKIFDASIWTKEALVNYVHNTLKNIESLKYEFNETEDSIQWSITYGTQMFDDFNWLKKSDILHTYYKSMHEAATIALNKLNLYNSNNNNENNIIPPIPNKKRRTWSSIHINLYFNTDKNEYILHFNRYSGSTTSFYYVFSEFEF